MGKQPPPRELAFSVKVDRLFAGARRGDQLSGLATIVEAPQLLPEVKGQRVFFVVWPESYAADYAPGAVLRVRGRFTALEQDENEYSFISFLFRSGVYYELDPGTTLEVIREAPAYERWARSVNRQIRASLSLGADKEWQKDLAGISQAMLLGRKEALDYNQKERFIESGTMHLFAVSGLHIGIIAWVLFKILDFLRVPRPIGAVIGLGLVLAYVVVVGQPPSARRAFIMVATVWAAVALRRKPSAMSALLLSALLILLWKPQELLRPGFQLSYSVVGGILMYGVPLSRYLSERFQPYKLIPEDSLSRRQRMQAWLVRACLLTLSISFAATLFSTPLTIAVFGVFSPGAVFLNALLLPLASVALVVAACSAVLGFTGFDFAVIMINQLCWWLNWLLERIVAIGLLAPGLFQEAQWKAVLFAPISLCFMFISYLTLLHLGKPRVWFFWVPPVVLTAMLVIGLRFVQNSP